MPRPLKWTVPNLDSTSPKAIKIATVAKHPKAKKKFTTMRRRDALVHVVYGSALAGWPVDADGWVEDETVVVEGSTSRICDTAFVVFSSLLSEVTTKYTRPLRNTAAIHKAIIMSIYDDLFLFVV